MPADFTPQQTGRFVDHEQDERDVCEHICGNIERGDADAVLNAIDAYCKGGHWMMNVGPQKGELLVAALLDRKPERMMEWGTFMGYSAILSGKHLKQWGGKLVSVEFDGGRAERARKLIAHAGLDSVVEVRVGSAEDVLRTMVTTGATENPNAMDLIFLDHVKQFYHQDTKIAEEVGVVRKGTWMVADNVIFPGCPDYLTYVRSDAGKYASAFYQSNLEYTNDVVDGIEISVFQ